MKPRFTDPYYFKPRPHQPVHPAARYQLASGLKQTFPKLSAEQAVTLSHALIKFLHKRGFQIAPADAFYSNEPMRYPDIFTGAVQLLEELDADQRRPWIPDGEK